MGAFSSAFSSAFDAAGDSTVLTVTAAEVISVTEMVRAFVTPVAVHAQEAVTVTDAPRVAVTPLIVRAAEALNVADAAPQVEVASFVVVQTAWFEGFPLDFLGDEAGSNTFWREGTPKAEIGVRTVTALDLTVIETITVTESLIPLLGDLNINAFVTESVAVAEGLRVSLNPLVVRVHDTISVADIIGGISRSAPMTVTVVDAITVGSALTVSPSIILLHVFDTISVVTGYPYYRIPVRFPITKAEFVRVRDVAKAQLYVGGGLGVRVHEVITTRQGPMFMGYQAPLGGTGYGDPTVLGVSPNPGAPLDPSTGPGDDVGADYWEVGL